jgi:hypothetical protein
MVKTFSNAFLAEFCRKSESKSKKKKIPTVFSEKHGKHFSGKN